MTKTVHDKIMEARNAIRDASAIDGGNLGCRIKHLRQEHGFTQSELSNLVGLSRAQIANIESGRMVTKLSKLMEFCTILKTDPNYLLGFKD